MTACSASTPSTASPESTSQLDRSATASSLGAGAALGGRLQDSQRRVFVLVSDAELQRGLAMGVGHVRRPPPIGQPRRHRRCQWPAGSRLYRRRFVPDASLGAISRLRMRRARSRWPRRSSTRRNDSRNSTSRRAHRTFSSRIPPSEKGSPSWSARSNGTTGRCQTKNSTRPWPK